MPVTYVDFRTAPIEGADYISEFTWVNEGLGPLDELQARHYFVNYPGAKAMERQLIEAVGGKPFVRYSCGTVLRAFAEDIPVVNIVACRTQEQKQLLKTLLIAGEIYTPRAFCTFDDIDAEDGEVDVVMQLIRATRTKASQQFGNAV